MIETDTAIFFGLFAMLCWLSFVIFRVSKNVETLNATSESHGKYVRSLEDRVKALERDDGDRKNYEDAMCRIMLAAGSTASINDTELQSEPDS